ncbi:hypothetical protein ACTXT7_013973 [Hymenolepis weldensis]
MEALLDPRICEIPRPGKKPLFTSGSLPQPPTLIQNECLTPILSLVENTLFIWNNWFVSLPPSLLSADLEKPYDAPNAGELFVHQDFNEYRVLAKDERQRSRRLNNQQLSQLRNYGRFDIESRDFPGYHHSWHISKGLQKGRVPALNNLKSFIVQSHNPWNEIRTMSIINNEYRKKCPIFRRREAFEYREYESYPVWVMGMGSRSGRK